MAGAVVRAREGMALRYASAVELRRDRLGEVRHGVLLRSDAALAVGERVPVTVELAQEKVTIRATAEISWVTPLLRGALAGVVLAPASHRDEVQLDLALGRRTAGAAPPGLDPAVLAAVPAVPAAAGVAAAAAPTSAPGAVREARALSVTMLEPSGAFRQALENALSRFGAEHGWEVSVESCQDAESFLVALAGAPRGLAIIDADTLGAAIEPVIAAIRSHEAWVRLPLIVLSSSERSRLEDPAAVFLAKPFATKAFVNLAGILVGQG